MVKSDRGTLAISTSEIVERKPITCFCMSEFQSSPISTVEIISQGEYSPTKQEILHAERIFWMILRLSIIDNLGTRDSTIEHFAPE
jgi:hypothetical protein